MHLDLKVERENQEYLGSPVLQVVLETGGHQGIYLKLLDLKVHPDLQETAEHRYILIKIKNFVQNDRSRNINNLFTRVCLVWTGKREREEIQEREDWQVGLFNIEQKHD